MTQEEIIRMAREAKADYDDGVWLLMPDELERFAQLVAAAEREACAKRASVALLGTLKETSDRVLRAIRARGQQ